MLHVTNGDCAVQALRVAGIEGDLLPWDDVLHEGPVPPEDPSALRATRARFLASRGWAPEHEALAHLAARDARLDRAIADREQVTLWFETDLYDVLHLLQVLDRVPPDQPPALVLVGQEEFVGVAELEPRQLAALRPRPVTHEQHALAKEAWAASTAADPAALQRLATGTPALPAIGEALHRLLEEYPSTEDGLSRTERQLLAARSTARTRAEVFQEAVRHEERPFLGDATAFDILDRLERGGQEERWIGGVRLPPGPPPYRWDAKAARLTRA